MGKYRTSQKVWAVLLTLVMVLGMIPPVAVTAVGADAVIRTADPSTMNDYVDLFLNPDTLGVELSTENAGGVWTDKSVFAANAVPSELTGATSELSSTISMKDTGDNFLVALSAIASNKEIVGYSTRPTDTMLVLDLSGSMQGSVSAMVTAANKAIGDLLALNEHNRVGVVLYSGNASFGDSTRNTATVLMPLGRYTTTSYTGYGANRVPQYIRSNNSEQVSVVSGVSPNSNLGSAKNTTGGTYTQNGIYQAMNQLKNADEKVIAEGSLQAGTTRLPIMVLMTDGEPSAATKNYTQVDTSNVGNGSTGTATAHDMAFLTQLTMAYAKREIDTAYATESLVYTLGYSVDNNDYARSVMDPEAYTTDRINTLWDAFNNTAAGGEFEVNDRGSNEDVTKHTDPAGKYAKELKDYRYYTDEYFPASRQSELTAAFQAIVDEIVLQSKYYPTYVENDHDHDGYITFTDKIGGYMEVTDVKGIVIGDTLFSGEKLARGFSEGGIFGSVENPSELGDNLVWSVMERLHIDDAATARSLLNNAYNYGQMGVAADGSWSNYIGWYSDENGKFLNFYDESLSTDAPAGATHIIKSYGMLGQTDAAHGISAEDMMYASIRITQELEDYDQDGIPGETFLTWQIPASLIPTITYQVTVETDAAGEIDNVTKVELENPNVKPIRLLYEIELREDIHEWNIADEVSAAYRDNTANKDAGYVFYTNQWKKENGTTDTTRNAYSHFEPSIQNEWYYYTEDAIIYTDQNGTKYTGAAAPSTSGTYYRAYLVYEKLETGAYRTHTHYEQISADSLAEAKPSDSNWVIPKGTVFRFWDPFQDTKSANNTATHEYSEYPMIVHDDASDHYYAYDVLGNNGKLTVTPATGIKLTKTLDEVVDGASNSFTFVIEGGSGNATLVRLDTNGEPTSRTPLTFADGKAEVTLAADETVYIIGLSDGVTYTITEKSREDYRVSAVTVNGQPVTGTAAQITAAAQTIQSVAFENTARGYGDLYVTKSIESDHNIPDNIAAQTFQIRVNVGTDLAGRNLTVKKTDIADPTQDVTTTHTVTAEGYIELTLANTQTAKILSLPEDTVVTVTETLSSEQQAYFTYTVKTRDHSGAEEEADNTVTIFKDMRSTATVTNEYNPVPTKLNVNFNGTKNFNAEKMTEDAEFTFRLQQYINDAWTDVDTASVTIPAGTKDASEGFNFDALELTFDKVGTYSCQILEDIGTNDDITYDRAIYTFTVVVTDNNGQLEAKIVANVESGDEANFGATQGTNGDWTIATVFNNEYHTAATDIDIKKVIVDNANAGKTGQGFEMESYNASVDANGVWTLGSFIRSATTDAKGEVRLVRNYDNTDFLNDTDGDNKVTYHFIIKEKNNGLTGWTYDNTHYLVTVVLNRTVSAGGTESITADFIIHKGVATAGGTFTAGEAVVESGNAATITFTNTFDPTEVPVDLNIVPTVMKHLEGRTLQAGEFTFYIYNDGDRQTVLATGTNDAAGDVDFDKVLTFDKVGTYKLDVVEEKGSLGGVTYDETVYDMVVVVTEANGVLSADYYFEDSTTKTATFRNTYDAADTEIIIEGTKTLTGKPILNGEFRFNLVEVTDATGTTAVPGGVTRTAANGSDDDANQTVSFAFDAIPYTTTGEYFYAITEEGAGTTVNGVTYTNKLAVVKVTVTDPGDGTLKVVSEVVSGTDLAFTNTYVPLPTHADLSSSKELTGRVMIDGEFEFTLTEKTDNTYATDKTGGVKETVKNDAHGKITFSTLNFDKTGDYYYVIEETQGSAGGVTYDETKYQVHISVVDDHKGKLIPTTTITQVTVGGVTEVETITFYNDYTIDEEDELILSGTKTLEGKTLTAGAFQFGLFDENGQAMKDELGNEIVVTNDASGNFTFPALKYDETDVGMTYTYLVEEILPVVGGQELSSYLGIAYDTTVYEVVVTITDDGEGGIDIAYTVNGVDQGAITFTNSYSVTGHDHVVLSGTKTLTGRDIVKDEFVVGLFEGTNKIAEAKIAANGTFSFGELDALKYDASDLNETYTYTVKELIPDGAVNNEFEGVTYDTTVYTVVVNVVDDGNGNPDASYTINGSAHNSLAFKNSYAAEPAEHILEATKIYEKGLKGDDFTFLLEGTIDGTAISQAKKNDKKGDIVFDKLTFANAGTYTFTVTEIDKVLGFINYSKEVYTVAITVTDNKLGQLEVTDVEILNSTGTDSDTITFENVYILDGDARLTIHGTKILTGFRTQVQEKEFTFGLYDSMGILIEEVTNAADGSFRFKALEYNEKDAGKTYTYTVKEIIPDGAVNNVYEGRTYDTTVYTVKVTVSDNNQGGIVVTHTVNGVDAAPISFTNKYEVEEAEVNLKGKKTYDKPLAGDDFTFVLKGEIDGEKIEQTKKNDKDGNIIFDTLTFTKEGTYTFKVKEQAEALGFIKYATEEYEVKVTVTDNNAGELVAEVTINGDEDGTLTFVNDYQMLDADNELTLTGTKTLTGRTMVANEFSFGLYDAQNNLIETVKNDANGVFAFTKLTYQIGEGETKEYTYTVKEIAGSDPCVAYDTTVYTVKVTVKDNGKGEAELAYTINDKADGKLVFANTYTAPADVVAQIDIQKKLVDKSNSGKGLDGFNFLLTQGEQSVEAESNKNGKASFQLTFTAADIGKTYEYKISEKTGKTVGMTYDKTVHTIKIKVEQNADGSLKVLINDKEATKAEVTFTNTYEKPANPVTGDNFPVIMLGTLMLISMAGITVLMLAKKSSRGGKYER